jgi:hypothetical protein
MCATKSFLIREVVLKLIAIKGGNWFGESRYYRYWYRYLTILASILSIPEIKEFLPSLDPGRLQSAGGLLSPWNLVVPRKHNITYTLAHTYNSCWPTLEVFLPLLFKYSTCSTISAFSVAKARTFISSTASSPSKVREISSRVAPFVSIKKKYTVTSCNMA